MRVQGERSRDVSSWVVGTYLITITSVLLAWTVSDLWHWFVIPTTVAGALVVGDAVDWLRGRLDVLEPQALLGLFGVYFFYAVPMLHVILDDWPQYVDPALDWRYSLGVVSTLNVVGLLLYRAIVRTSVRDLPVERMTLDLRRFKTATTWAVIIGLTAFAAVMVMHGGPVAYLNTLAASRDDLAGTGWLLLLAESWPLLLFAVIVVARRDWLRDHRVQLALLLVVMFVAQFLTGGLRGSRSNTVWPMLIAVILVHLVVVRIRKRDLVWGMVALTGFMWVYGFYKTAGLDAVDLVTGRTSVAYIAEQTGRDMSLVLLEDFGRAGVQALVVDRMERGIGPAPVYGETYLGDLAFLMPETILPDPPADKVEIGTDVLYGPGWFDVGERSSRIYGLLGEGMLNFGVPWAAVTFVGLGAFVRYSSRLYRSALASGALPAALMASVLTVACILLLGSDLGNFAWFLVKQGLLLAAVVWVSRTAQTRHAEPFTRTRAK
ncbi:hypothetical protein ACWG8W_15175 [Citricoccus zhacaiensis]